MPPKGKSKFRPQQNLRIAELALQDDPELSFEEVLEILIAEFPSPYFPTPAISTLEKMIRATRRASKHVPDERWSIGVSGQAGIPNDAMRIVTDIWKHVLLSYGRHITLRQAQWIARLKDLVTDLDTTDSREERLYKWASLYAGREKAALTLNLKLNTSDMDASLLIRGGVYGAVVETGLMPHFTDASRLNALALSDRNLVLEEFALRKHLDSYLALPPEEREGQGRSEAEFRLDHRAVYFDAIPDEDSATEEQRRRAIDKIEEAMFVCAVWRLAIIRDGKRWNEISEQRRRKIELDLARKSVEHHIYDYWSNPIPFEELLDRGRFRPSDDILKEVGYELPRESEVSINS